MPIGCEVDTDELPPDQALRFKELVERSGVMHMQNAQVKGARDVYYYLLRISDGDQEKQLKIDQISLPEDAKPLIDYLVASSQSILAD